MHAKMWERVSTGKSWVEVGIAIYGLEFDYEWCWVKAGGKREQAAARRIRIFGPKFPNYPAITPLLDTSTTHFFLCSICYAVLAEPSGSFRKHLLRHVATEAAVLSAEDILDARRQVKHVRARALFF